MLKCSIRTLVHVMAALILIQLAAKATGDAEEDHSSAWVPAIYVGVWRNFLAPDFVLAPDLAFVAV